MTSEYPPASVTVTGRCGILSVMALNSSSAATRPCRRSWMRTSHIGRMHCAERGAAGSSGGAGNAGSLNCEHITAAAAFL